jgi:hypothetical protein
MGDARVHIMFINIQNPKNHGVCASRLSKTEQVSLFDFLQMDHILQSYDVHNTHQHRAIQNTIEI